MVQGDPANQVELSGAEFGSLISVGPRWGGFTYHAWVVAIKGSSNGFCFIFMSISRDVSNY